jgi:hypothetical protein
VEAQNEGAEKVKQPLAARIEPKHRTDPSFVVGDVIVTYRDGTTDSWTLKGNCMDPKVSHKGQVGWVLCELAADGKSLKLNGGVRRFADLHGCSAGANRRHSRALVSGNPSINLCQRRSYRVERSGRSQRYSNEQLYSKSALGGQASLRSHPSRLFDQT